MRKIIFLFVFLLSAIALSSAIYAQNDSINSSIQFQPNATLDANPIITPDSSFYFIQRFLDLFSNDLKLREEKIAEIKLMVQQGKIDAAKIALKEYLKHANALEEQANPEQAQEINESASAIYNTFLEIENQIPSNESDNFNQIIDEEKSILTASQISLKIKSLCEQLSNIDPVEYSRTCKVSTNSSDWQKRLDQNLTSEQKKEIENFGSIMEECFKTSGQTCRCSEIQFKDFAATCLIAAPLAVQCNIKGNESACLQLSNLTMPELPPYLQEVMNHIQEQMSESQFNSTMLPNECKSAGITNSKDCFVFMIKTHAPDECKQALIDANVQNPRDAQEICNQIMFKKNAPAECINANITNPEDCQKFMFSSKEPKPCIDAGLTGEFKDDFQKCAEIMNNQGQGNRIHNCASISNPDDRLKCYDSAAQGAASQEMPEEWPQPCKDAGAFTIVSCQQIMNQYYSSQYTQYNYTPGIMPNTTIIPPPSNNTTSQTTSPNITNTTPVSS